jgi:two-component system sensor histidine kinase GlrK
LEFFSLGPSDSLLAYVIPVKPDLSFPAASGFDLFAIQGYVVILLIRVFLYRLGPRFSRQRFPGKQERILQRMRFTIFKRMASGYALIMLMVVFMGIYVTLKLNQLTEINYRIARIDGAIISMGEQLLESLFSQAGFEMKYLVSGDPDFHREFSSKKDLFTETMEKITALTDTTDQREQAADITVQYNAYVAMFEKESALLTQSNQPPRKEYLAEREAGLGRIDEALRSLIGEVRKKRDEKVELSSRISQRAIRVTVVTAGLAIGLGILISFYITRSIGKPISVLGQKTKEIAAGKFHKISDVHSPPEIKQLAEDLNFMSERLEQLDNMKSDFISHVSHELRTPLTSIKAASSMLLEGAFDDSPERQNELLAIIHDECDRLIGAVNRILDISRMDAGMMDYTFLEGELPPLVQKTVLKLAPLAQRKTIDLELLPFQELPLVRMDRDRVLQVLENLLGNALKFTSPGGKVIVSLFSKKDEGGFVQVSIADTGPGIPKEHLARIFERFKRIEKGRETTIGTGLGLSIVKHIIADHGGKIWVRSVPGKGSVFSFALPVA